MSDTSTNDPIEMCQLVNGDKGSSDVAEDSQEEAQEELQEDAQEEEQEEEQEEAQEELQEESEEEPQEEPEEEPQEEVQEEPQEEPEEEPQEEEPQEEVQEEPQEEQKSGQSGQAELDTTDKGPESASQNMDYRNEDSVSVSSEAVDENFVDPFPAQEHEDHDVPEETSEEELEKARKRKWQRRMMLEYSKFAKNARKELEQHAGDSNSEPENIQRKLRKMKAKKKKVRRPIISVKQIRKVMSERTDLHLCHSSSIYLQAVLQNLFLLFKKSIIKVAEFRGVTLITPRFIRTAMKHDKKLKLLCKDVPTPSDWRDFR